MSDTNAAAAETSATLAEAAAAAAATTNLEDKSFDDAFKDAMGEEMPSREDEDKKPSAPAPAVAAETSEDKPAAPAPAGDAPKKDDVDPVKARDDEFFNRLQNILQEKPKADAAPAPAPAPAPEPAKTPEPVELLTAEEKALVDGYVKDWPENAKAEALIRKVEHAQVIDYVFREMMGYIQKQIIPKLETVDVLAEHTQGQLLVREIPDLNDEMVDAIGAWVEEQPDFLQNAYKDVITQGTVPQLKAVVDRFKAETGWQPKVQQDPAPAPAARQNAELPAAAKQAAASLAPVSGKRSAVPQSEDKGDFAASFARYAALDQI